jgi:hypothetical protein
MQLENMQFGMKSLLFKQFLLFAKARIRKHNQTNQHNNVNRIIHYNNISY